jgi:hypothetical protein
MVHPLASLDQGALPAGILRRQDRGIEPGAVQDPEGFLDDGWGRQESQTRGLMVRVRKERRAPS